MKFLFVAPRFHTNQYFVTKTLLERGHEVAFHVTNVGGSEDHGLIRPQVVPASRLYGLVARFAHKNDNARFRAKYMMPSLARYWPMYRAFSPDVVVVRDPNRLPSLLALAVARVAGAGIILYAQGPKYYPARPVKHLALSALLTFFRAAWITPVLGSPEGRTLTHRRSHYLPFPIEAVASAKTEWFSRGAVNLLCVGKFQRRKNHVLLLRALAPLRERYDLRLVIIGERSTAEHDAEYRRVLHFIEQHALSDWVDVRTNVPFREMLELYSEHDLFVLPSTREPVSVSVLEAMARGLPVVCSTTNGARSYVRNGVNGYVFASDDVSSLRGAIETAVSDRARLMAMGRASLELVGSVHAPRSYYAGLMSIVGDVAPRETQAWLSKP